VRKTPTETEERLVAVPRAWLLALPVLIVLPWLIVAGMYWRGGDNAAGEAPLSDGPTTSRATTPSGTLVVSPIIVSPPLEYVSEEWGRPPDDGLWFFPDTTPDALDTFLSSSGLAPDQVSRLKANAHLEPRIRGIVVRRDDAIVRAMSAQTRATIYRKLGQTPLNFDQANAFKFYGNTPEDWLKSSPISQATRAIVEPLIFKDGDFLHFADARLAQQLITDAEELRRLAKVLHLLPGLARNRLYRYPQPTTADENQPLLANCLWSALNFFGTTPDDRYLNVEFALKALREDYYIVQGEYQLGDIIGFVDAEGDLFHVAVHIADDLVFTKNGTSPVTPWTIMPLDRVVGFYHLKAEDPRLIYHRRKDF
jgi:hypothetical protein